MIHVFTPKKQTEEMFYMGEHVDDIILARRSEQVKADLSRKFDTKDLEKLELFPENED